MLKTCFGEGDMELYDGKVDLKVKDWESFPVLSLREAAMKASSKNEFHVGRCYCKKGCEKSSCSCKKRNAPCTSKCHSGSTCQNQPVDNVSSL